MMNDDKNDSPALLILRLDGEAVHALLRQVETENGSAKANLMGWMGILLNFS